MKSTFIVVLCLAIVIVAYKLYNKDNSDTTASEDYSETTGYKWDSKAKKALKKATEAAANPDTPEDYVENAFVAAEIVGFNVAPNAAERQEEAVETAAAIYGNVLGAIEQGADVPHEGFIIDRAVDFADTFAPITVAATTRRRANAAREAARVRRNQGRTPGKIADLIIAPVASDPQNVHDSNVNDQSGRIYRRIKEKNLADDVDIANFAFPVAISKRLKASGRATVDTMLKANTPMVNLGGDGEREVLRNIIARVNSRENTESKEGLEIAVADALNDAGKDNFVACASGRCARLIGAMTLLDRDEVIAAPLKTKDMLRNDIMYKAYNIAKFTAAADPEGAERYDDDYIEKVRGRIERDISADYPDESPSVIKDLIEEAKFGV